MPQTGEEQPVQACRCRQGVNALMFIRRWILCSRDNSCSASAALCPLCSAPWRGAQVHTSLTRCPPHLRWPLLATPPPPSPSVRREWVERVDRLATQKQDRLESGAAQPVCGRGFAWPGYCCTLRKPHWHALPGLYSHASLFDCWVPRACTACRAGCVQDQPYQGEHPHGAQRAGRVFLRPRRPAGGGGGVGGGLGTVCCWCCCWGWDVGGALPSCPCACAGLAWPQCLRLYLIPH
jgi:hypothetical protein